MFLCQTCFKCLCVERKWAFCPLVAIWEVLCSLRQHGTAFGPPRGLNFHPFSWGKKKIPPSKNWSNFFQLIPLEIFLFSISVPHLLTTTHSLTYIARSSTPSQLSLVIPVQLGVYNFMKMLTIHIFPFSHCWGTLYRLTCFNLF